MTLEGAFKVPDLEYDTRWYTAPIFGTQLVPKNAQAWLRRGSHALAETRGGTKSSIDAVGRRCKTKTRIPSGPNGRGEEFSRKLCEEEVLSDARAMRVMGCAARAVRSAERQ